jgi:molybdopterin-guanine dinucleotide biosynthesis protein B
MQHLSPCDLVLIEGYKRASIPKLEVHRPELGKPLLSPQDPDIVALASDVQIDSVLPQFRLSDYDAITAFVIREAISQSRYPLQS